METWARAYIEPNSQKKTPEDVWYIVLFGIGSDRCSTKENQTLCLQWMSKILAMSGTCMYIKLLFLIRQYYYKNILMFYFAYSNYTVVEKLVLYSLVDIKMFQMHRSELVSNRFSFWMVFECKYIRGDMGLPKEIIYFTSDILMCYCKVYPGVILTFLQIPRLMCKIRQCMHNCIHSFFWYSRSASFGTLHLLSC